MQKLLFLLLIAFFANSGLSLAKTKTNRKSIPDTLSLKHKTVRAKDSLRTVYMYIPNDSQKKVITMKPASNNFTYIFPIITLVLGILLNRGWDYYNARSKSDKIGKRWIAELRFLETPISQQIDALDTYVQNQTEATFEIQSIAIYSSLDGSIFKTLDKSELLRYLELKKNCYAEAVKVSNSTHGYINILTHTYEALKDKFEDYLNATSNITTSFSKNLSALRIAYADYGVAIEKKNPGKDPIKINPDFAHLTNLMSIHILPKMQTGDYNPFEMDQNFFAPFLKILSNIRLDDDSRTLTTFTSACLTDIAGLRMERQYLRINFTTISDRYKESLSELDNVVANLENK